MCHAQRPVLTFVMIHLVRVPLTCKQLCCVNARLVLSGKTQIFCKFCKDPTTNYAMRYLHVKQKGRAQSCGQRYYSGVGVRLTQAQWCVHISWLACDHPAPGPLWHRTAATCLLWHCVVLCGTVPSLLVLLPGMVRYLVPASRQSQAASPRFSCARFPFQPLPGRPLDCHLPCRNISTWPTW